MSEPPPRNASTSEPEPSVEPHGPAAEPIPEWSDATSVWSWGWDIHWLGFGCLYLLMALYAAWSVVAIARETKRRRRVLSIFINCLLFIFGLSRGLYLFINPYESPQCHVMSTCPILLSRLLFAVGLPCLTAAFSFIHLLFVKVIKLKVYPRKLQSWKFLLLIVTFHFMLAFFIESIVYIYADWKALSLVCQVFYIAFSIVLSTSFLYTGGKIIKHVHRSASRISHMGSRSIGRIPLNTASAQRRIRPYTPNVSKLVKITYITASLGFACCALQLYSIFGIYNMYRSAGITRPKPIPWLVFQSIFRLVELAAAITMAYVSPKQTKEWSYDLLTCFSCCNKNSNSAGIYSASYTSNASHKIKIIDGAQNGQQNKNENQSSDSMAVNNIS